MKHQRSTSSKFSKRSLKTAGSSDPTVHSVATQQFQSLMVLPLGMTSRTPTSTLVAALSGKIARIGLAGLVRWSFRVGNVFRRQKTSPLLVSLEGTRLVAIGVLASEGEK